MDTMMKACVITGPGVYDTQWVPVPQPSDHEVLLRIHAITICGSDPRLFQGGYLPMWHPSYPFVAGHECAGEIVELGSRVTEFQLGDRVSCESHCGCGQCEACRSGRYNLCENYAKAEMGHRHYGFTANGGYAQYAVYNTKSISNIPAGLSYEEAALADTAAISLWAVRQCGTVKDGWTVIFGPGPIGNFAMQIAKAEGAKAIVVGRGSRLQLCQKMGAYATVDYEQCPNVVERIRAMTAGCGAHRAIECAGTEAAICQTIKCLQKGGHATAVSMPEAENQFIPYRLIVHHQLTIHGSRANPNMLKSALELLAQKKIDAKPLISHRFTLNQMHQAMDTIAAVAPNLMKVLITPNQ